MDAKKKRVLHVERSLSITVVGFTVGLRYYAGAIKTTPPNIPKRIHENTKNRRRQNTHTNTLFNSFTATKDVTHKTLQRSQTHQHETP